MEQRLRFGKYQSSFSSYKYEERILYDNLFSEKLQEYVLVDSVSKENMEIFIQQDLLFLDLSYILKSVTQNRWRFYGGVGLELGVGFNSIVNIDYQKESFIDAPFYYGASSESIERQSEMKDVDNTYTFLLYIPAGLEFRLGNSGYVLQRSLFGFELRPGIRFISSSDGAQNVLPNWSFRLGFRYVL